MHTNFFESIDTESTAATIWNKYDPAIHSGHLAKHAADSHHLVDRYFTPPPGCLLYQRCEAAESIACAMIVRYARLELPGVVRGCVGERVGLLLGNATGISIRCCMLAARRGIGRGWRLLLK